MKTTIVISTHVCIRKYTLNYAWFKISHVISSGALSNETHRSRHSIPKTIAFTLSTLLWMYRLLGYVWTTVLSHDFNI